MPEHSVTRRLAAILAADVVGYTRLMGADEAGTLARLTALRQEVIAPLVAEHRGRIVKLMGDGLLVEFASIVDAVVCAVAWQDAVIAREAEGAPDSRLSFRIAVHLGDIIVEGDDIHGEGVNIAARLEPLATPNGLCLSDDAWRQVRGKLDLQWTEMGPQQLKNVAQPVVTYSLTRGGAAPGPSKVAVKPSVAVLPFTNMSRDPEQEYFSDGITEDLITELSRFRELTVVSRSSSFVFKDRAVSIAEAAERLGVQYIVEGSIRKAGKRGRITAQLIDARSDTHIWAERYDRELEDIFAIQDDVVRRVASTLVGRLEHQWQERAKPKSTSELRAYELYLRAREHFFAWSLEDNRTSAELLNAAIAIEPDYAAALALLSEVRFRDWINGWSEDPRSDNAAAYTLAAKAVELDESDSRTHTALAMACLFRSEYDKARHHFETALRLNPNDTRVLVYSSRLEVFDGQPQQAIELADQALQLNPFGKYNWNLGIANFVNRRYDEAASLLRNLRDPTVTVLSLLAASQAMAGRDAEARATTAQFMALCSETPMLRDQGDDVDWRDFFAARWPFSDPAETEHLMQALHKAGIPVAVTPSA
jgi:TolB-like protein/cytochrome c-type biogenesis protein CcmH/NrfG